MTGWNMFIHRMQWAALVVAIGLVGCDRQKPVIKPPVETWVSQKWETWPQIVLTNDATFNGHTAMQGASSFLIQARDGRIFAVTAKHLLGDAAGVSPEIQVSQFNNVLKSWKLAPRTKEKSFVQVDKLVAWGKEKEEDWLIFSLKSTAKLPSRPLKVRGSPVSDEEQVYLLGCPYAEDDCQQNVHAGHVLKTYEQEIHFDFSPTPSLSGFSGAPLIDGNGHLVGILVGKPGLRADVAQAQNVLDIYQWLESTSGKSGQ
ncbi:MAG TPA: serine protease [Tepidisphaeraceae bacterium]|nr:serine protease [Tepidisphaeraceae bacterium]